MTAIVRIEHSVTDFDLWKSTFDSDPIGREQVGVRAYRITRGVDDPNAVGIDLDFADVPAAERFSVAIRQVWQSARAASVLAGMPQLRILDQAEAHAY